MNVTINTDASYCAKTEAGGYAFWIVCDLGRIKHSGMLKSTKQSEDAELKCLANAVVMLTNSSFNNGNIEYVYINSDCKSGMNKVGLKSENVIGEHIAKSLKRLFKNNPLARHTGKKRYQLRHVKAHSNKNDTRSYVNEWCDREAKKQMKILRKSKLNSLDQ